MALIESILSLHAQRGSQRRIARELGIDRGTVGIFLRQRSSEARPVTFPTRRVRRQNPDTNQPTGSGPAKVAALGPQSLCELYRKLIRAKLGEDPSAKRIWQD